MIDYYKLNEHSSILDVGCAKGFLLYEFKKIIPNLLILIMAFASTSCISDVDENNNRNYDLYSKIMCPVCDGQTIGESQASIANDMKNIVDSYISDGKTDDEILKYFEDTPASQWNGECFVFDYRVSVDKQLQPGSNELCFGCNMPLTPEEKKSPHYEEGFTCPDCYDQLTEKKRRSLTDKRDHWKRIL